MHWALQELDFIITIQWIQCECGNKAHLVLDSHSLWWMVCGISAMMFQLIWSHGADLSSYSDFYDSVNFEHGCLPGLALHPSPGTVSPVMRRKSVFVIKKR